MPPVTEPKRLHIVLMALVTVLGGLFLGQSPRPPVATPKATPPKPTLAAQAPPLLATAPNSPAGASLASALPQPHGGAATALADFMDWYGRYLKAEPAIRTQMEPEGRTLAAARRPVFHQLIQSDPRTALQQAVPMVTRQQLPPSITHLLENRVANRGVIRNYWASPSAPPEAPIVLRYAELENGSTYRAHVYGRFAEKVGWTMNASLNGIELDGDLAVNESPLRMLEIGEVPDPARPQVTVCPVSGITSTPPPSSAPITEATSVVEANGQVVYLCDGSHTVLYEKILVQGEASSGGAQIFTGILPAVPTPSVGMVKVLFIRAVFPDHQQVPCSEATAHEMLRQTAEFYQTNAYGRLMLVGTVTPPIMMPHSQAWYFAKDFTSGYIKELDGLSLEMTHAKDEAKKLGFDWNDYHCTILRDSIGAGGPSRGGGGNVWLRGDDLSTMTHEIGHAFLLQHANFWETNGSSVIGPGSNAEYGDMYDNMGGATPPNGHYNAQAKNQIKWLPDAFVPEIIQSGLYRIHAFDTGSLQTGQRYALKVRKDQHRTYWGEYRTRFTGNVWASNGLLMGWKWPSGGGTNLQLLDTTPGSSSSKNDAAITPGRTFSDTESGVHITTLAVNLDTVPRSIDVQVNLGAFSGNHPPVLSLSPATAVVPLNVPVTFTATAADEDGDPLAFGWYWPDQILSPSSSVVTRSFPTAGVFSATCIASDMKGGRSIRNLQITVGNGAGRFTISGRITRDSAGLSGIMVSTGGSTAITDDDGYYTIANLAAGTYSLIPATADFTFTEQFNNSITVGPSYNGANYTADPVPVVTLTAPAASALEGGGGGAFRLERTGNTAAPLTISLFGTQGTATKTSDYVLNPDYANAFPYWQVVIPADQSFLDISVTPVDDGLQEGAESVTLMLTAEAGYACGSQNFATVTIDDNDTAVPRVTLSSATQQINEAAGGSLTCTLTRTGSTAASLSVPYTASSADSATPGQDYTTLSGSVLIPAGAAAATFLITPINDSDAEENEFINLSIQTSAALIAGAEASSLAVQIIDDDTPTVTLGVADAAAAEVDRSAPGVIPNPATFTVTRSGNAERELRVFYSVSGTALHGVDYELLTGSVIIPADETQAAITIMPRFDDFGEPPETVNLWLAAGNQGYEVGTVNAGTVTISDSDSAGPLVEVTTQSAEMVEPSANGQFLITARGTGTGGITVRYSISGTAVPGLDYSIAGLDNGTGEGSLNLTLNNGNATTLLQVTALNDAVLEDTEAIQITMLPDPAYTLWGTTQSSTMLLRDDDQPLVMVDSQVGLNGAESVVENIGTTVCKFFISRTGSTATPLTVNYSMQGSGTNGVDYTALPGSVVIPAGIAGVDITLASIDDSLPEGTESVVLHLEPGAYTHGPDAVIYITDNSDGNTVSVNFSSASSSGSESTTTVSIPVTVTPSHPTPVTVEYVLDSGTRATTVTPATTTNATFPCWLRMVRNNVLTTTYYSIDGVNWAPHGAILTNFSLPSTSYFMGLAVGSGISGQACTAVFDEVSITGLASGGTVQGAVEMNVGSPNPAGSSSIVGGTYTLTSGGSGFVNGSTDNCQFVHFAVGNSSTCTLTARLVSFTGSGGASSRAGLMMRESTASNARQVGWSSSLGAVNCQSNRTTAGNAVQTTNIAPVVKPCWVRLQRVGDVFTSSISADGTLWNNMGSPQNITLSPNLVAGLTVSAKQDGLLTKAVFDNYSLTPASAQSPQAGSIGFVSRDGFHSQSGSTYTLVGSGAGMGVGFDSGYFLGAPVTGDFIMIARILSQEGGSATAQAGIMARESYEAAARFVYAGASLGYSAEFLHRRTTNSTAQGMGLDHNLVPGLLTFAVGESTKNITFNVIDDAIAELPENITISLRYATGALNTIAQHTYTIIDDDAIETPPALGFAGGSSAGSEADTPARLAVTLSEVSELPVSVNFSVTTGSASAGSDFTASSGTLQWAPGQSTAFIEVPIIDDSLAETAETCIVTLDSPVNAVLTANTTHTFTIQDNDTPLVTILATDATAREGSDTGAFTITRTGSTAAPLTVAFSSTGSAVSGADFIAFSPATSIIIPAGQSSANLMVTPVQDTTVEAAKTVIVAIAPGAGYAAVSPDSATVTLDDDDANVVSITASIPTILEGAAGQGQFTVTRAGSTTAALTVFISGTGTALSGTDYTGLVSSVTFPAGQSSLVIPITILQDSLTEGSEEIVASISSSAAYLVGNAFANVTITDDDLPPVVFISNPATKVANVASGHGLILTATAEDDGFPQSLSFAWSRVFGPGEVTFEEPGAATTGAQFSAPGLYYLRVTVTDGQFSVADEVFVQVGGFNIASWISVDQGPPAKRGGAGSLDGAFFVSGSGSGYTSASDSGHLMFRQLFTSAGNATITARLVSLTGPATGMAGITMRDASLQTAKRVLLMLGGNGTLQFHQRSTFNTVGSVSNAATGLTPPLWLKIDRIGGVITASYAPDVAGTPGTYVTAGTSSMTLENNLIVGMAASAGAVTSAQAAGVFDQVTVDPSISGPAVHSEDLNLSPVRGSSSESGGVITINGAGFYPAGGHYRYQQVWGDCIVTARLTSHTGAARGSQTGIVIRDLTDGSTANTFLGNSTIDGFTVQWGTYSGGSGAGGNLIKLSGGVSNWLRLIRKGNIVTAYRAVDIGGAPGTWIPLTGNVAVVIGGPMLVGCMEDSNSNTQTATGALADLTILPLNNAPVISPGALGPYAPFHLQATITDDGPFATLWTKVSGPGVVTFADPAAADTLATLSFGGPYRLRLTAADHEVRTYQDLSFTGWRTAYEQWQSSNFTVGAADPDAERHLDPDHDGLANLIEYALGTDPHLSAPANILQETTAIAADRYLRLTVTKNPAAIDVTYEVQATSTLTDPNSWTSAGLIIEADTSTSLRVRDHTPLNAAPRRFMRVRVSE
ncbi:MAG: Calx-beta domain-containing protein [Prosthecobacter sp.]|nr:Calx-beta domain-containing protein [Prosthecobacter sp.]